MPISNFNYSCSVFKHGTQFQQDLLQFIQFKKFLGFNLVIKNLFFTRMSETTYQRMFLHHMKLNHLYCHYKQWHRDCNLLLLQVLK